MTRRSQTGTLLNPQEQLSLLDALALYTTAGAWIGFEEQRKGRIRPGMLADLVVLDRDLTTVPVEEIHTINVTVTIVGGEIVWSDTEGVTHKT
jgi:predicted amidohydrolase YtcJ